MRVGARVIPSSAVFGRNRIGRRQHPQQHQQRGVAALIMGAPGGRIYSEVHGCTALMERAGNARGPEIGIGSWDRLHCAHDLVGGSACLKNKKKILLVLALA